jgi:hypothetical protein
MAEQEPSCSQVALRIFAEAEHLLQAVVRRKIAVGGAPRPALARPHEAEPGRGRHCLGDNRAGPDLDAVVGELQRRTAPERAGLHGYRLDYGDRPPGAPPRKVLSLPSSASRGDRPSGPSTIPQPRSASPWPMRRVEFGSAVVESTRIMPGRISPRSPRPRTPSLPLRSKGGTRRRHRSPARARKRLPLPSRLAPRPAMRSSAQLVEARATLPSREFGVRRKCTPSGCFMPRVTVSTMSIQGFPQTVRSRSPPDCNAA